MPPFDDLEYKAKLELTLWWVQFAVALAFLIGLGWHGIGYLTSPKDPSLAVQLVGSLTSGVLGIFKFQSYVQIHVYRGLWPKQRMLWHQLCEEKQALTSADKASPRDEKRLKEIDEHLTEMEKRAWKALEGSGGSHAVMIGAN